MHATNRDFFQVLILELILLCSNAEPLGGQKSVVGIAIGYGPDNKGFRVQAPVGLRICSPPHRPDKLWGPPNLLPNGYLGLFPQG
jgi:hypothetical protein